MPFFSVTVTVFVPLNGERGDLLVQPRPLEAEVVDVRLVLNRDRVLAGLEGLDRLAVPFFSEIVKPGPVTPFSFVGAIAPVGAASASAATRPAARSEMRVIFLLCVTELSSLVLKSESFGFPTAAILLAVEVRPLVTR